MDFVMDSNAPGSGLAHGVDEDETACTAADTGQPATFR